MSVQALDRTFDILELLVNHQNGLGVTQVSKMLELHKSTVSRLLLALKERGYIEKDPATGQYRLGLKLIELAGSQIDNLELKIEAKPALHALSAETGLTVFLAILRDNTVVYIDKAESFNSLRRYSIIGTTVPVYCSALGKALLFSADAATSEQILSSVERVPRTAYTVTELEILKRELETSRERGYSLDNRENEPDIRCLGAPVYDYRGHTVAAVSVSGYARVVTEERISELGTAVRAAAQEISRRLGYHAGLREDNFAGRNRHVTA